MTSGVSKIYKKPSNSVISKHRENVFSLPEKSGLLWRWSTFSSHKLVNIYNRIRPGKREWKLYLFFVILEILDCGIMQLLSSVQRSLGFDHNVIILHCTGNCVHMQLRSAKFVNVDPGSQSVYSGQFG